jgi:uncharacterized protein
MFMKGFLFSILIIMSTTAAEAQTQYDSALAKRLGANERGMKSYVLCILKTGPNDGKITGEERDKAFAGHFANIQRMADAGELAVAGPFGKNDKSRRGLYIFNCETVEAAEKLVVSDPAVKAGVFGYELTPWFASAALMITNETHKRITKAQQ